MEGAVLAMALTMSMMRVRRTPRAVGKALGKRPEQTMGRGNNVERRGKGNGKGKATEDGKRMVKGNGKGNVLFNKPKWKMISLMLLLCSCKQKQMRLT